MSRLKELRRYVDAELDKMEEAIRFFGFATRLDLDNYNRNTREGLHITSIALAWINIVYGFAGGTKKLYDFIDDNPVCYTMPVNYVNNVQVIAVGRTWCISGRPKCGECILRECCKTAESLKKNK